MTRHAIGALTLLLLTAATPGFAQPAPPKKAVEETPYNPYQAEHELEVGLYYLKTKAYDAAIARFQQCIAYRPNYARPRLLLAQAYERKGNLAEAARYYQEYLKIHPSAKDAAKITAKIVELNKAIESRAARKKSG
jgi:tetratricopeptide (TPR) repeat protein